MIPQSPNEREQPKIFKMGPGSLIANRFEVVERIGAGGMGIVYKVIDRALNDQVVALKVLNPFLSQNESVLKRFMNEVLVARSLSHPNIVRIHDIGTTEDGFSYISMEYVEGKSLIDLIMLNGDEHASQGIALPFDDALSYLFQILNGVAYAHEKGVIHRDLKPANVLIAKSGEVKLADFGTARVLGEQTGLTQDGQSIGTPDYMSPEQIRGEPVDKRSDIYALGIIAYQLVTGKKPFVADSPVAVAFKHVNDPFPFFANEEKGIPKWFEATIHKATAKKKENRFASAEEFVFAIAEQVPELRAYAGFSATTLPTFQHSETPTKPAVSDSRFTMGDKHQTWVFELPFKKKGGSGSYSRPVEIQVEGEKAFPVTTFALVSLFAAVMGGVVFFLRMPTEPHSEQPSPSVEQPYNAISNNKLELEQQLLAKSSSSSKMAEDVLSDASKLARELEAKKEISSSSESSSFSVSSGSYSKEHDEEKQNSSTSSAATSSAQNVTAKQQTESPVAEAKAVKRPEPTLPPKPVVKKEQQTEQANEGSIQERFNRSQGYGSDQVQTADVINMPRAQAKSQKLNGRDLLGAHVETYKGDLVISGSSKKLSLQLLFQGDKVTGLADVAGEGTFEISGGLYSRGIELRLTNGSQTMVLTGTKRENLLRGTFTVPSTNRLGQWNALLAQ